MSTITKILDSFILSAEEIHDPKIGRMYECENFGFEINPSVHYDSFNGTIWFEPVAAAKQTLWFFEGDRNDKSIIPYIPSYGRAMNKVEPFLDSNYGHVLYKQGLLDECVNILKANSMSRQACIMINNNDVMFSQDKSDKLCTNSISFRIRDNRLNMSVHMRSNDILNMMPYDMYQFCIAYGVVYSNLLQFYPQLKIGKYYHSADSMHTDKASILSIKNYVFKNPQTMKIPSFASKTFKSDIFIYSTRYVTNHYNRIHGKV